MKSIGFIGLGEMGKPIAKRILEAHFPLSVYDKDDTKTTEFGGHGAFVAHSARELAERSDIVMSILPGDEAVENAMLEEEHGVINGLRKKSILIEMSTTSIEIIQTISKKFTEKGAFVLDAPVGGIPPDAATGRLIMLVGGDETAYENCREVFRAISELSFHLGDVGTGRLMKYANNLLVTLSMLGSLEVAAWAKKCGMNLETFVNVIKKCKGTSPTFEIWIPKLYSKSKDSPMIWLNKDLDLALKVAGDSKSPMPFSSLAKQFLVAAKAKDEAPSDLVLSFKSLVGVYEEFFDVELLEKP